MTTKTKYYTLKKEGRCVSCWHERGKDGTETMCRSCATKSINRSQQWKDRKKALGLCTRCGQQEAVDGNRCEVCQRRSILLGAKHRARRKGISFDITLEDVDWVNVCPALGIPIVHNTGRQSDNSPSLDRLIPELGYVKGNVQIISYKANRIKNDATAKEIRKVADWLDKIGEV